MLSLLFLCDCLSLSLNVCDDCDSAVYLDLADTQLSGSIPTEIGLLTQLDEIWLESNDISGPIPTEIGNLSQLRKYIWTFDRLFAFFSCPFWCD